MKPVIYIYTFNIADISLYFCLCNCGFKLSLVSEISSTLKARGSYSQFPPTLPPTLRHEIVDSVIFNPPSPFCATLWTVIIIITSINAAIASWCIWGVYFGACFCRFLSASVLQNGRDRGTATAERSRRVVGFVGGTVDRSDGGQTQRCARHPGNVVQASGFFVASSWSES